MRRATAGGEPAAPGISNDDLAQALRREEAELRKREQTRGPLLSKTTMSVAGVLIVAIYGILIGLAVPPALYVVTVTGGGTAAAAQTAFVDPRGLDLFLDALRTLTAGCMLPATDPAMALATIGTHAHTDAGWAAVVAALAGNFTNGTGCQFYGLEMAQGRAGGQAAALGPVDMCHAYVNIGIDLLHALAGFHLPANITTYLNLAYDLAYPLNLFWGNTNDPVYMRQQVTARLYQIVLCLTQPGTDCTARPIDVQGIATQFCNVFFATDDLSYYNAAFMPWLKFPFPGLLPRDGDNVYAPQVRRLLSPQSVAALLANGTALNASVAAVYVLDDPLANGTDVLDLALDALLGGVPRYYPPLGGGTRAFLELVANHLQALDRGETIVVAARYARDFNLFNSVNFVRSAGAFPPPLFFLFSNFLAPADHMPATPANLGLVPLEIQNFATSAQVVNLLDVVHTLGAFDRNYSREYAREKLVATFTATAINPILGLNMTATLQLLDTFALKNTVVQGRDLGGHVAAVRQGVYLDGLGYATGYKPLPLAVEAQVQTVIAPALARNRRDQASYPPAFDYRNGSRAACLRPSFAQGACGETWATAVVSAQSARFCLRGTTRGWANLSLAHVAACAAVPGISNGCEPGHPAVAATFLATLGAVSEQCFPAATTPPCDAVPCAPAPCLVNCPGAQYTLFRGSPDAPLYYRVSGLEALKSEVFHNGPLVACYDLPVDFYAFFAANPAGCYANDTAPAYGGDCAVVVGYAGDRLYLRSTAGPAFAHQGDFCVVVTPTRLRGSAWFANEAWAALTDGATTRPSATAPIPAGTDRTPSLIVSPPTTVLAVEPVNRR